ncbi:MAG: TonB family protein [Muribaculaceae bacterium]|nr:TonB family protein [Muribaculaceae bacterium]
MNKFLLFLLVIIITCGVSIVSCPKYEDHHSTIKQEINQVINKEVSSHINNDSNGESFWTLLASSLCSNITEYIIDNKLYVENYIILSVGKINIDGEEKIVSIGAFNHVFTQIKEQINEYLSKLESQNSSKKEKRVSKEKQSKKNTQKKEQKVPIHPQHKEEIEEEDKPTFDTCHSNNLEDNGKNAKDEEIEVETKEHIYTAVEQMPQFPGGYVALMKYLNENINYPQVAFENGVQGCAIVQFVVTKNGTIGEVKIIRSVDRDLDKEAVRLCKSLPKFIPGKMNGQEVNVWYTLPITFKHPSSNY